MPQGFRFRHPGKLPPWSREPGTAYLGSAEVYPPEIGDGSALTRVTGLIPNGWDGYGSRVADPADRQAHLVRPRHSAWRRLGARRGRPRPRR